MKNFYKKFQILVAFTAILLSTCVAAFGQYRPTGYITIGTESQGSHYCPIGTFYNYSYTQQLYTASEIQACFGADSNTITAIAFNWIHTTTVDYPLTIYMGNTAQTSLSSFIPVTDLTQVYTGTVTFSTGWITIPLTTPFQWDGQSSIVVAVNNTKGDYETGSTNTFNCSAFQSLYVQKDGSPAYDPTNLTSSPNTSSIRPNIRFYGTVDCESIMGLAVSNINANGATLSWNALAEAQGVELEYRNANDTGYTAIPNVTGNTYTFTGLTPITTYNVRIRSNCGNNLYGTWENISFKTSCDIVTITSANPYREDFENYAATSYSTAGVMADCWDVIYTGSSAAYAPHVYTGTSYAPTANSQCLFMRAYNSSSYGPRTYAILPEFSNALNTLQIAFAYSHYSSSAYSQLSVGYMTNILDSTSFVWLADVPHAYYSTNRYNEFEYNILANNIPAGARLALRMVNMNTYTDYTFIDDLVVRIQPTCLKPTQLSVSNITANSAVLSWTANTGETQWEIERNGLREVVNSNPFTLTNLPAATHENIRVRAICSATDSSEWSSEISFITDCQAISITSTTPYEEDFENYSAVGYSTSGGVMPNCWTYLFSGSSNAYYPHVYTGASYAPTANSQCLFMCAYNNTTYGPRTYAILPEFTNALNTLQIAFAYSHYSSSSYSKLTLGYMTDAMDSTTFVALTDIPHAYYYTNRYNEFEYNITDASIPTGARLALRTVNMNTYTDYTFIDDVVVRIQPTCIRPSSLAVSRIDSTEVDLSWTENGSATTWEIEYGNTGFVQGTGTRVVVTSNPYTITGLTYGTTYDAYVRAICSATDTSLWSHSNTFTVTACTPAPSSVDYSGITNVTFGVGQNVVNNTTHPSTSPYYGDYTAQMGDLQAASEATISVTFETEYTYGTVIWVNWNNDLVFTDDEVVYTGTSLSDAPTTLVCTFDIPANTPLGTYTMRIGSADSGLDGQISNGYGYTPCYSSSYGIFEDYTINVIEAPTCPSPRNLTVSNIDATSATIAWTPNGDETSWLVNIDDSVFMVTTNPYTLTGLADATQHSVSVAAFCSVTDTSYFTMPVSFATLCLPRTITFANPFIEDFSNYTATTSIYAIADQPLCWDFIYTGSYEEYAPHVYNGSYAPNASDNALVMVAGSSSYGNNNIAILPNFTNDLTTLQLLFKYKMESSSSGTLSVGYVTDINSVSSFTSLQNVTNSTTGTNFTLDLNQFTIPTGARLAFKWSYTSSWYAVAFDDVVVRIIPSCREVTNITATQITNNSAQISWTSIDTTQNQWEISYNGTTVTANSNPFTLTGLTSNTDYAVNVRAVCSANDYSYWVIGDYHFTTACDAMTLTDTITYSENFDSYTGQNSVSYTAASQQPSCWNFVFTGTGSYDPHVYYSSSYTNGNNALLMTTSTSAVYDTNVYSVLPAFTNALEDLEIDFDVCMTSSTYHTLSLGYMTDAADGNTFVELQTIPTQYYTGGYRSYEIYLTQYGVTIPTGARLAFRWHATISSSYYALIDNVRVRIAPTCIRPQNLSVSNISMTGATFTWHAVGDETQWEVTVGTVVDTIVNDTTVTVSGLAPTTHFDVNVRALCSATDMSEWSDTLDFMTLCDAITITRTAPYIENFDNYALTTTSISTFTEQPDCWNFIYTGTSEGYAPHIYNGTYAPNGNNSLVMTSGDATYGSDNIAIFPLFSNALNTLEVSFKTRMESTYSGTLYAGYITNSEDASTFVTVETIPSTTSGTAYTYELSEQTFPANARLAFKWSYTSSYYTVAIDDIDIRIGCEPPTNVTVDEYNTIRWESDADTWTVMWIVNGDTTTATAHNSIYTISNLPEGANVTVMIQAVCDATHSSAWSEAVTFNTTPCEVPTNITLDGDGNITWESDATSWHLYYTVNGTAHSETVTTNSFHIEGLNSGDTVQVRVQAVCGTDNTSDWSETQSFTHTGISGYTMENLNVFPNPTNGVVNVRCSLNHGVMQVYDVYGRLLISKQIESSNVEIDLSGYADGVYMLRMMNDGAVRGTARIVKQ